jgi:hypothetical protein
MHSSGLSRAHNTTHPNSYKTKQADQAGTQKEIFSSLISLYTNISGGISVLIVQWYMEKTSTQAKNQRSRQNSGREIPKI